MVYRANVLNIMIASPSDVSEQRDDIRSVINDWNFSNSYQKNLILMPVGWETHSAPDLGGRAQEIINARLGDGCDLLVGVFWTRLGTPTGGFESGTAEEIFRHVEAGRPAMVYFSNAPVAPQSIDIAEYERVRAFKSQLFEKGLVEEFTSPIDFKDKFRRHLEIQINGHPYLKGILEHISESEQDSLKSAEMSEEAAELLISASEDAHGTIMTFTTMGGRHIQTNGKVFGNPGNARSSALWESALGELRSLSYVVPRGAKGETYQITNAGYIKVDQLRGNTP
ncbi:hypothetical protein [Sphingomonas oryzagri]